MDKIKIFTAVLALAGCMENGFGMQEDIKQKRIPVTIDLNDKTSIWATYVTAERNGKDVYFENIDFTKYKIDNLYDLLSYSMFVQFYKCNMPEGFLFCEFPPTYNRIAIEFIACNGIDPADLSSFEGFLQCGSNVYYYASEDEYNSDM